MKLHVLNCTRRLDGQYQVIVSDTCGGKNKRPVLSDREVKTGSDVEVREGRVINRGRI